MAFIRSWNKHDLYTSLYAQSVSATAAGVYTNDFTTLPTLVYWAVFTHTGVGSGAVIELFDNTTAGTKFLHLESSSGDRAPFGLSSMKPILCSGGFTVAATATGLNASFGYYNYAA